MWSKIPTQSNCNICSKDLRVLYKGKVSTSKLENHLKSMHPDVVRTRLLVQRTVSLLKPFMQAQKLLEGEKYVTISLVFVMITQTRLNLIDATQDVTLSQQIRHLAAALLEDFNKRWGSGADGTVWSESSTRGNNNRRKGITTSHHFQNAINYRTASMNSTIL